LPWMESVKPKRESGNINEIRCHINKYNQVDRIIS
jgi:hypothetical protein